MIIQVFFGCVVIAHGRGSAEPGVYEVAKPRCYRPRSSGGGGVPRVKVLCVRSSCKDRGLAQEEISGKRCEQPRIYDNP